MNPDERKPVHWCSVHAGRWCRLARQAEQAWRKAERGALSAFVIMDRKDFKHTAIYAPEFDRAQAQAELRAKQAEAAKAPRQKRRKAGK